MKIFLPVFLAILAATALIFGIYRYVQRTSSWNRNYALCKERLSLSRERLEKEKADYGRTLVNENGVTPMEDSLYQDELEFAAVISGKPYWPLTIQQKQEYADAEKFIADFQVTHHH